MAASPLCKIVLYGQGGVGKTTWRRRLLDGQWVDRHVPTLGVETAELSEYPVMLWDCGSGRWAGLCEGYAIGADAAVVMFARTSPASLEAVPDQVRAIRRVAGAVPIVVVGNKVDALPRAGEPQPTTGDMIDAVLRRCRRAPGRVAYCDLSAKSMHNYTKPFELLGIQPDGRQPPRQPLDFNEVKNLAQQN